MHHSDTTNVEDSSACGQQIHPLSLRLRRLHQVEASIPSIPKIYMTVTGEHGTLPNNVYLLTTDLNVFIGFHPYQTLKKFQMVKEQMTLKCKAFLKVTSQLLNKCLNQENAAHHQPSEESLTIALTGNLYLTLTT